MNGYIYIMSNPSYGEIIKIGMTQYHPKERKIELHKTGVPTPFKIEYYALVKNYEEVEKKVHLRLKNYRLNPDREFFNCTIGVAVTTINKITKVLEEKIYAKASKQLKIEKLKEEEELIDKIKKEKGHKRKIEEENIKTQKFIKKWQLIFAAYCILYFIYMIIDVNT